MTSYTYDTAGNTLTRTDANNHTTTFAYDDDGHLSSETTPIGEVRSFSYDAAGNRATEVDPRGNATPATGDFTTTRTYDRDGRLSAIDYSDATPDVTYAYDARALRRSMTDGAGTETRSYDDAGHLLTVVRGASTLAYAYDAASNITRRTYPGGAIVDSAYDDDGHLQTVTDGANVSTYDYDAAGYPATLGRPNGTSSAWTYDRAGRTSTVTHSRGASPFASYSYSYDNVGNPTTVVAPEGTITYGYDGQDRLKDACYDPACAHGLHYTYDGVGNRLTQTTLPVPAALPTIYAYNADDELTSASSARSTTTYAYDAAGNETAAGSRTLAYDLAGRTSRIADPDGATTYTYDGDGKRLSASRAGSTTSFGWDPSGSLAQLLEERDGSGALLRRYDYGDALLSQTTPSATSFYHADALGSVTSITDGAGDRDWSYTYEPFGARRSTTQLDPFAAAQPMGFTGQYLDPTGLYHLRARQYDASSGRFTSRDPLDPEKGLPAEGSFAYAYDAPLLYSDPTGQRPDSCGASQSSGGPNVDFTAPNPSSSGSGTCESSDDTAYAGSTGYIHASHTIKGLLGDWGDSLGWLRISLRRKWNGQETHWARDYPLIAWTGAGVGWWVNWPPVFTRVDWTTGERWATVRIEARFYASTPPKYDCNVSIWMDVTTFKDGQYTFRTDKGNTCKGTHSHTNEIASASPVNPWWDADAEDTYVYATPNGAAHA